MRTYCSVPDCFSIRGREQMFHIPQNQELCLKWKKLVGNADGLEAWQNGQVCELHFKESDFTQVKTGRNPGRKRLKKGTIPSQKLPDFSVLEKGNKSSTYAQGNRITNGDPLPFFSRHTPIIYSDKTIPDSLVQGVYYHIGDRANDAAPELGVAEDLEVGKREEAAGEELQIQIKQEPEVNPTRFEVVTEEGLLDGNPTFVFREQEEDSKAAAFTKKIEMNLTPSQIQDKAIIKQLQERVYELRDSKKNLQKLNCHARIRIGRLKRRQGRLSEKDREEALVSLLEKHFSRAQVRCLIRGEWMKSKMWEERDYRLALTIYTISKRCFHYLRNHRILPLPSYNCLRKHIAEEGSHIKEEVEQFLAAENKCNCGEANCHHSPGFAADPEIAGGTQNPEIQLAVMKMLEDEETIIADEEIGQGVVHHQEVVQEAFEEGVQEVHLQEIQDVQGIQAVQDIQEVQEVQQYEVQEVHMEEVPMEDMQEVQMQEVQMQEVQLSDGMHEVQYVLV